MTTEDQNLVSKEICKVPGPVRILIPGDAKRASVRMKDGSWYSPLWFHTPAPGGFVPFYLYDDPEVTLEMYRGNKITTEATIKQMPERGKKKGFIFIDLRKVDEVKGAPHLVITSYHQRILRGVTFVHPFEWPLRMKIFVGRNMKFQAPNASPAIPPRGTSAGRVG